MSAASATTRPSVPSPFSEEGVGYAPALRTLMMEQGATSLPGCFIEHNSLIPCMTMSMFLAPVHRTHVDAAARGEGLCSRRGMDITNLQGCLTFVIYPVTIAVDEAVIAGSANRIETGEIIVPGGTLAALSTTLHDSYLSIHWTLSAGYCAFDPAASSPVGAVTLLGESAGLQSFFGGEITDPLEFNAWLSKQCGESSHLMMLGELDGCHIVAEDCLGFPPGFRRSPLTSRPLGQKGTFLGSNDTLSTGSEGNIRTVDFSDDAPGLEFILTSPPAVAAGFEPSDRQSPLTSRPLGQKVEFLGLIDALSAGSKGNISTIDFSDDVPGAEFILTPPPAVAAGFERGWLRSPCLSSTTTRQDGVLDGSIAAQSPGSKFLRLLGDFEFRGSGGEQRTDPPLAQALFDGFCIDQVELAFARTSILVKYLVPLLPAQPSAVSVENYSVAMSLVLAAEEPVSTAPRDIFPHVCDGAFFPHVCVGATATMLCLLLSSPLDLHDHFAQQFPVERFMLVPATGWIFLPTSLHLDRSWPHFLCRFETWLCMKVVRPCLVTRLICGRARSHETLIVPSVLSFEVPEVFRAVSLPIVIELWWQWDMLMAIDMERKTFSTSTFTSSPLYLYSGRGLLCVRPLQLLGCCLASTYRGRSARGSSRRGRAQGHGRGCGSPASGGEAGPSPLQSLAARATASAAVPVEVSDLAEHAVESSRPSTRKAPTQRHRS
jgi:hypothetical protein